MELSIITLSYNTKDILRNCLRAIKKELSGIDGEVIIVDNASNDGSLEMIKKEFPEFVLVCNEKNLGFSKGVNQGLKLAQGDNIFFLNSDTEVQAGCFKKMLAFEKKIGPAAIGPRLLNLDRSVQPSVFHLPSLKNAIFEFWLGKKGLFEKYTPPGKEPQSVEAVLGGAMLVSRKVIEKIGYFDERYFFYFEDLDYCRRIKNAGFKIYYYPSAEVIHENGASGKNLAPSKDQWKRMIPSSKVYYGLLKHYLITAIIWSGQKWHHILGLTN